MSMTYVTAGPKSVVDAADEKADRLSVEISGGVH